MTKTKAILGALGLAIAILGITSALPAQTRPQPASASQTSYKDQTPPNPNRPQYDLWGNEWTATGQLMRASCPNKPDPISHRDNPQCGCPAPTSQGVYYLQGYDKNTGAAVCRLEYYHACPYADAQPADGAVCAKLRAEHQQPATTTPPKNQCGGK